MIITDKAMLSKMEKALKLGGGLFTLDDIEEGIKSGHMQSHTANDTWAVTRVHDWPSKRSVDVLFVVGNLEGSVILDREIEVWAKKIGANMVTATGRDGWWKHRTPGWKKVGIAYSKDI